MQIRQIVFYECNHEVKVEQNVEGILRQARDSVIHEIRVGRRTESVLRLLSINSKKKTFTSNCQEIVPNRPVSVLP